MTSPIYAEIEAERVRAHAKHGASGMSAEHMGPLDPRRLPILVEEVGEVARALNDGEGAEALRREIVQVAAMAAAWAESFGPGESS